ncbi:MAG: outer membrane beta-barrel protein [Rickettsiales bacterium]|jgi:opacity protein-like surface antigen|nr:outer membrane beta-barrel protein [Rickettsiales bacterium]
MKKLIITSFAALTVISANAAELNPYVSEKISFSRVNVLNPELVFSVPGQATNKGTDESDNVFGNKLAVGLIIPAVARVELEWGINTAAKVESGLNGNPAVGTSSDIKTQTFGVNAYYDFDTGTKFTPYIGAGAGFAYIKSKAASYGAMPANSSINGEDSINTFIWNVGIGASYALTEELAIDVGYRYSDLGTAESKLDYNEAGSHKFISGKADLISHEITLGARYAF